MANEKVIAADQATKDSEKVVLLEEAHQLNSAAVDNQREALALLEEASDQDYVAKSIPLTNTSTDYTDNPNTSDGNDGTNATDVANNTNTTDGTGSNNTTDVANNTNTTDGTDRQ